jgi:hypothetical protein
MLLPALPEPRLTASLIPPAGYGAAARSAALAAAVACAVIAPRSRKRVSWDALVDMAVGLSRHDAAAPGAGWTGELILGKPGLGYDGPWTAGIGQGWLVVVGVTNPGPSAVRGGDFSTPLTFAFPGRQVHASRILREPDGRARGGAPSVSIAPRSRPGAGHASVSATGVQLSGDFLLRPGDSYCLLVMLTGTPAADPVASTTKAP